MAQLRLKPTGIVILVLILSLISFGLGFGLWSLTGKVNIAPTDSSAGGCDDAESPKECGGCGGPKSDGSTYACKWIGDGCRETGKKCGGTPSDPVLPPNTACSNPNTPRACVPGDTKCQSGGTGWVETCVDLSTGNICNAVWRATGVDTRTCPTSGGNTPPTKGNLTIQNGCAVIPGGGSYNIWSCQGWSYEQGNGGCQEGTPQSGTGGLACPRLAGFCGWIQVDVSTTGPLQFASWYVPCNEETPETPGVNVCNGGGVKTPTNSADYEVGEVVVFSGYAYDTDGINKSEIVVKVDGVVVGNATATDKSCPAGSTDASCVAAAGKPVVDWTYSYTVTTAGAHTFAATWEDTKGITGASCQGSRVITSNIQGNPDWEISKTGASVCVDKTAGAQKAQVDYTITIKNVGDLAGQLSTLVDTQDAKVKSNFIQENTIVPDADVSGKTLTWDVSGALGQFAAGQSKTLKYSMIVPQASFGTYINTVTGTPDSGDAIQTTEVTIVGCDAPQTGLFDSTASKVILGMILIAGSAIYLYSEGKILTDLDISGRLKKKRKEDFENRVAGA
jgi:hypothetical protein